jgi:hypothetical protein
MQTEKTVYLLRVSPSIQVALSLALFFALPTLILLNFKISHWSYDISSNSFQTALQSYLNITLIFLTSFILGSCITLKGRLRVFQVGFRKLNERTIPRWLAKGDSKLNMIIILFSIATFTLYWNNGGNFNILNLGNADISGREFRFYAFDNIPRIYSQLLNISRRILLPIALLQTISKCIINDWQSKLSKLNIVVLATLQIIGSSLTFARFPFMVGLGSVVIPFLLLRKKTEKKHRNFFKTAFYGILIVALFIVTAGLVTNIQYNITDPSILEIIRTGWDFGVSRAYLVPSMVPIRYSIIPFPESFEFLGLQYSRISSLIFGTEVVGTNDALSFYVTPVGIIGDIWRNFGYFGIVTIGFLLGVVFLLLDYSAKKLNAGRFILFQIALLLLLSYWIYGVFFSQGSILVFLITILVGSGLNVRISSRLP